MEPANTKKTAYEKRDPGEFRVHVRVCALCVYVEERANRSALVEREGNRSALVEREGKMLRSNVITNVNTQITTSLPLYPLSPLRREDSLRL